MEKVFPKTGVHSSGEAVAICDGTAIGGAGGYGGDATNGIQGIDGENGSNETAEC